MGLSLLVVLGCAGGGGDTAEETAVTPATFADLQYVFDRNCTGSCHAGDAPSEGLLLTAGDAYASLVGVPSVQVPTMARVTPGDADGSYLVHKLEGTHADVGGTGTAMPPYLVLADNELALFRDWIDGGADP